MKIVVTKRSDKALEKSKIRQAFTININGKCALNFCDGESKENTLAHNFNDVYKIPHILLEVYSAGLRAQPLNLIHEESDVI